MGVAFWPAIGRSRDGSWSEPGVAVAGLDRDAACELGQRYRQLAVYELTEHEVRVVRSRAARSSTRPHAGNGHCPRASPRGGSAGPFVQCQQRDDADRPAEPGRTSGAESEASERSTTVAAVDVDRQIELLTAGAVDVISEAELRKKLETGRPLRVKLGHRPHRLRHPSRLRGGAAPAAAASRISATSRCSSSATSPRWSATRRASRRPGPASRRTRSTRTRRATSSRRPASSTRRPSGSRSCATPSGSPRSTWRPCCR